MRTYEIDGDVYLSVTAILDLMFPFDQRSFDDWCRRSGISPTWVNAESRRIGTLVSETIENAYYGMSFLNPEPMCERDMTYYTGILKFLDDYDLVVSEKKVVCKSLGYAGTLDAIVKQKDGEQIYVDFKTYGAWRGEYKRSEDKLKKAGLQLSMYQYADTESHELGQSVVVFTPDGGYIIEPRVFDDSFINWIRNNSDKLKKYTNEASTAQEEGQAD